MRPITVAAGSPEAVVIGADAERSPIASLDLVIGDMEAGFVRCDTCGSQESTATLDFMSDLRDLRDMLAKAELPKLAAEFDASPAGASWDEGHPIFQMAADVDRLNAALERIAEIGEANGWSGGECATEARAALRARLATSSTMIPQQHHENSPSLTAAVVINNASPNFKGE